MHCMSVTHCLVVPNLCLSTLSSQIAGAQISTAGAKVLYAKILLHWGPYIKDVRTEGGGGVGPKADIGREVAWI